MIFLLMVFGALFTPAAEAARELFVVQAYELKGGESDAVGIVAASISITNISTIPQTVSWSGGVVANRVLPGILAKGGCGLHGNPDASIVGSHPVSTEPGQSGTVQVDPEGSVTLYCVSATPGSSTSASPGGEGFLKVKLSVKEDRGAVIGAGAMFVEDRRTEGQDNPTDSAGVPLTEKSNVKIGWGTDGSGPFPVNGGRPF